MFRIFLIVFALIITSHYNTLSQEQLFEEEISLEVEGFTPQTSTTVTYTLEAYGAVYANSSITSNYLIANEEVNGNWSGNAKGWYVFWEPAPFEPIANGFYKLYTDYGENYVYIDLRDCQWANQSYPYRYPTDFWIKYNSMLDKFYYKNKDAQYYTEIPERSIIGVWTIKGGEKVTSCFTQYEYNSLAFYAPLTKAKLFWAPPPPEETLPTKYRIWYAWKFEADPAAPVFYWIGDVNSSLLDFTDLSNIDKNPPNNSDEFFNSYYYIEAINGTQSLYTSNIVKNYSITDWTKTLKITNNNNRPRLVWAPYWDQNNTYNYKVYRKVETIPPGRPPAQYQYLTEISGYPKVLSYTDNNFTIGGNSLVASYYVVPTEPGGYAGPSSNIVSSNVLLYKSVSSEIPEEYFVNQNYPNPFNPSTKITYSIKEGGLVKLRIFDILGSEVAMLVNEIKESGDHSVEFIASNLPSGVYIYTLQVNEYTKSKKMLLLK